MSLTSSSSTPWLSVIIPVHCGEAWIEAAIESIFAEKADGIEVLVFDSSPSSKTLDCVRNYSDRLMLRLFEDRDQVKWHAKTNAAAELAKADHLCWLHQDDLWLPGRAAAIRSWIDAAPQTPLHLAPSAIINQNGQALGPWRCPLPEGELSSAFVIERLLIQNFISAPAPVFRKDAWRACGGLDETLWYTADWDMWLKLAAIGPVIYHEALTTGFRIHGSSQTVLGSRHTRDFTNQMQIVFNRHLSALSVLMPNVERAGRASIAVNTALASAAAGDYSCLIPALVKILQLGPSGIHLYMRDSRILNRMIPRVRAKLAGAF